MLCEQSYMLNAERNIDNHTRVWNSSTYMECKQPIVIYNH